MADVIYTPDKKALVLLRSGDFLGIVEEYAGKDVAAYVELIYDELSGKKQNELPFIY